MEKDYKDRIRELIDVVLSYASHDFDKRAVVSQANNEFDALASGINMLGEELKRSTISLNEKTTLLQEMHHRVKNNLQLISSIMSLQAELSDNPELKEHLVECKSRVGSMALVHDKLHLSDDLRHAEVSEYLQSLFHHLKSGYTTDSTIANFYGLTIPIYLHIDQLTPLGLILNELMGNSYKHAFPENRKGKIDVKLEVNNKKLTLEVSDNGIGFTTKPALKRKKKLGLQLIDALTEQLDGQLTWDSSSSGTTVSISFALSNEVYKVDNEVV